MFYPPIIIFKEKPLYYYITTITILICLFGDQFMTVILKTDVATMTLQVGWVNPVVKP